MLIFHKTWQAVIFRLLLEIHAPNNLFTQLVIHSLNILLKFMRSWRWKHSISIAFIYQSWNDEMYHHILNIYACFEKCVTFYWMLFIYIYIISILYFHIIMYILYFNTWMFINFFELLCRRLILMFSICSLWNYYITNKIIL